MQFQGHTDLNLSADVSHEEFWFTAVARFPHINFRGGDRLGSAPAVGTPMCDTEFLHRIGSISHLNSFTDLLSFYILYGKLLRISDLSSV